MKHSKKLSTKNYQLKTQNQQVLILLGPPGSGKGTQAILLSEKLNLFYLETSKLIEKKISKAGQGDFVEVKGQRFPLLKEKENWERGELCSPALVVFWMKQKIKELVKKGKNLVFAGSPRTVLESKELVPLLENLYGKANIKIFLLELSVKESVWRNSHRRICQLMRHPVLYNEETEKLTHCPLDGSKLIKRALDKPEIIKKRYKVYQEKTLPLVDYFKKQGLKVHRVNGAKSPASVFQEILKFISTSNYQK